MRRGQEEVPFYDNIGNGLFKPEVRSQKNIRLKGFLVNLSFPITIMVSAIILSWLVIITVKGKSKLGQYLVDSFNIDREMSIWFFTNIMAIIVFISSTILLFRVLITIYRWWKIVNMDGLWLSSDGYVDSVNRVRFEAGHKLFLNQNHIYYRSVKYGILSRNTIYAMMDLGLNLETRLSGRRNGKVKVWLGPITNKNGKKASRLLGRYISWMKDHMEPLGGDMNQMEDLPDTYREGKELIGIMILDSLTDTEKDPQPA